VGSPAGRVRDQAVAVLVPPALEEARARAAEAQAAQELAASVSARRQAEIQIESCYQR